MAFVTRNRTGRWEIRESRSTPKGPRSETLASFASLDHRHIELAIERSSGQLDRDALIAAARKSGAPVALPAADAAALTLLRALGDGSALNPNLRAVLSDALSDGPNSDLTEEVLKHAGKSEQEREDEVVDLLLLTDAYPATDSSSELAFPGIPETDA